MQNTVIASKLRRGGVQIKPHPSTQISTIIRITSVELF